MLPAACTTCRSDSPAPRVRGSVQSAHNARPLTGDRPSPHHVRAVRDTASMPPIPWCDDEVAERVSWWLDSSGRSFGIDPPPSACAAPSIKPGSGRRLSFRLYIRYTELPGRLRPTVWSTCRSLGARTGAGRDLRRSTGRRRRFSDQPLERSDRSPRACSSAQGARPCTAIS